MCKIKLSLVCPSYNSAGTIEKLIKSVIDQSSQDYELIIVDGGSTDKTVSIISKYSSIYTNIKYISEPDLGIYDAMNKGIVLSSGEWLFFVGSDDFLYSNDAIENIFRSYIGHDNSLIIAKTFLSIGKIKTSKLNYKTLFFNTVSHQGILYKREIFEIYRYNINYKTNSEYELHLDLYLKHIVPFYSDVIFCNFSFGGVSGMAKFTGYREEMIIRHKALKNRLLMLFLDIATLIRFSLKKLFLLLGVNLHIYKV